MSISSASVRVTDWPATASGQVAVGGDDARHGALAAGRQHADRSPGARCRRDQVPGEAAEVEVRGG
jgi:hypothetical protein